ncbi:hypothetical protein D3C86_1087290 [compost metagenome]
MRNSFQAFLSKFNCQGEIIIIDQYPTHCGIGMRNSQIIMGTHSNTCGTIGKCHSPQKFFFFTEVYGTVTQIIDSAILRSEDGSYLCR